MHKSNPPPSALPQSYIDQAYERAKQRLVAAVLQSAPEAADHDNESEPRSVEQLLNGPELCRMLREPLGWLLSLAQGLAIHDPLDVAAVQRVRAATVARLSGRQAGLRAADVLTVLALLGGALDPTVVLSAVSSALSDEVVAMLGAELPLSVYVTSTPDPRPTRRSAVCTHPHCPLHAQVGR